MTQHDYVIDGGGTSRTVVRTDIQAALQALASNNKGPTPPATPYDGMVWIDDAAATWFLKRWDGADWTVAGAWDAAANLWIQSGSARGLYIELGAVAGDVRKVIRLTATALEIVDSNAVGAWEMIDSQTVAAAASWISPTIDTAYRYVQGHFDLLPSVGANSLMLRLYNAALSEITSGYRFSIIRGLDAGTVNATGGVADTSFYPIAGGEIDNNASYGGARGRFEIGDLQSARYKRGESDASYYNGGLVQSRAAFQCDTTSIIRKVSLAVGSGVMSGTVRLLGMR